jgi:hypothetical protein
MFIQTGKRSGRAIKNRLKRAERSAYAQNRMYFSEQPPMPRLRHPETMKNGRVVAKLVVDDVGDEADVTVVP